MVVDTSVRTVAGVSEQSESYDMGKGKGVYVKSCGHVSCGVTHGVSIKEDRTYGLGEGVVIVEDVVDREVEDRVFLSVGVIGDVRGYQWRRNGVNIEGANSDSYDSVLMGEGDEYDCVVSSVGSEVVSMRSVVSGRVVIEDEPRERYVCYNICDRFSVSVIARGASLSYQWQYKRLLGDEWRDMDGNYGYVGSRIRNHADDGWIYSDRRVFESRYGDEGCSEGYYRCRVSNVFGVVVYSGMCELVKLSYENSQRIEFVDIDVVRNVCRVSEPEYSLYMDGDAVSFAVNGQAPAPLLVGEHSNNSYRVILVDEGHVAFALTYEDYLSGNRVNLVSGATGTCYMVRQSWWTNVPVIVDPNEP